MRISDVAEQLDRLAPAAYAEPWDNVGLLVGDPRRACRGVCLCVDLTPAVLAEARRQGASLIVAYHPAIFKPLARVTPRTAPAVYQALRAGVGVYSVHTAYDAAVGGANDALADALGMGDVRRPLAPRAAEGHCKVVVYMPESDLPAVSSAAFGAGAGTVGEYTECGFGAAGTGTFRGGPGTHPTIGRAGRRVETPEIRWETICLRPRLSDVLAAVRAAHSYEEPAIDVLPLTDAPPGVGLGRVGALKEPVPLQTMLARVRRSCGVRRVQLARPADGAGRDGVAVLAVGCGSCGELFRRAVEARAELYVTGELRHHDALAAVADGLTVVCVGHSNSERLTLAPLARRLAKALPGLKIATSQADRDPYETV